MAHLIIYTSNKRTAKAVIDRIAKNMGLNHTDWKYCAKSKKAEASLCPDNKIVFSSDSLTDEELEREARKATRAHIYVSPPARPIEDFLKENW